jgi:hypothetical protein
MPSQPDLASVGGTDGFDSGEAMVNERSVRASAGILFLLGFSALSVAFFTGDSQPLQGFAIIFLLEMGIRLGLDHRFSPSMIVGALATRTQRPEWVSLEPKKWAWGLGFALALSTCLAVGWSNLDATVMMIACSVCLALLFAESALGICVGCYLFTLVRRKQPQHCAGDTCHYTPPSRRSLFSRNATAQHTH